MLAHSKMRKRALKILMTTSLARCVSEQLHGAKTHANAPVAHVHCTHTKTHAKTRAQQAQIRMQKLMQKRVQFERRQES